MLRAMHGSAFRALALAASMLFGASIGRAIAISPASQSPPPVAKRKNKPNRRNRFRPRRSHQPQAGRLIRRAFY